MRSARTAFLMIAVIGAMGSTLFAAEGHPVARPYPDMAGVGEPSFNPGRESALIPIDHLTLGAEHILDQQCHNGGFGWPHDDCSATRPKPAGLGAYQRRLLRTRQQVHVAEQSGVAASKLTFVHVTASDGFEALERLREDAQDPDVILLDAMMPNMSGIEVLEQLRESGSKIPVLMISAHLDAAEPDRMRSLGASDAIPKPFEWEDLIGKIEELAGNPAPTPDGDGN